MPKNLRRTRMSSFAKTPNFLKSPRSMASSKYAQEFNDHEFGTIKILNEEIDEKRPKR